MTQPARRIVTSAIGSIVPHGNESCRYSPYHVTQHGFFDRSYTISIQKEDVTVMEYVEALEVHNGPKNRPAFAVLLTNVFHQYSVVVSIDSLEHTLYFFKYMKFERDPWDTALCAARPGFVSYERTAPAFSWPYCTKVPSAKSEPIVDEEDGNEDTDWPFGRRR